MTMAAFPNGDATTAAGKGVFRIATGASIGTRPTTATRLPTTGPSSATSAYLPSAMTAMLETMASRSPKGVALATRLLVPRSTRWRSFAAGESKAFCAATSAVVALPGRNVIAVAPPPGTTRPTSASVPSQ